MKSNGKWILVAVLLVVLIAGAGVLYNKLSPQYSGDKLAQTTKNATTQQTENNGTQAKTQNQNDYTAPDFTVLDYEGNEVKLSDYKGKPVVLNFWATWCYYCKEEMPDFNVAYEKYPDVQFLMVNATDGVQETVSTAKKYVEDEAFTFPVFFDTEGDAVNAYYVSGFPSTYFINAKGELVTYANGMLDLETLEKGIEYITE